MNAQSDTSEPYGADSQSVMSMSATRPMYWSIRRELWENRSIYLAPLIVGAVVVFATLIGTIGLPARLRSLSGDPVKQLAAAMRALNIAPAPIMFCTIVVGFLYCLDALYGDRRDRSILFWKSLPVSDRTTVLSKLSIPLLVLPVIALALSIVAQLLLLIPTTAIVIALGMNPFALWGEFIEVLPVMAYGLTVHALWFAPIYGWLLLVSAWARRTPILWALFPPLAIVAVERAAFSTSYFMYMLQYRFTGAMREAFRSMHGSDIDQLSQLTLGRFLTAPGLWVGLVFAALCIAATVRLRRNREPI